MKLQTPTNKNNQTTNPIPKPNQITHTQMVYYEENNSTCSTPYVSAPSSSRGGDSGGARLGSAVNGGFFYSAPASPMHFAMNINNNMTTTTSSVSALCSPDNANKSVPLVGYEFEFSARFGSTESGQSGSSMSSADELFLNGKIRPMKLSNHLERPQVLAPLLNLEDEESENKNESRGRDLKLRDKSLRRRTRSMSPLRTASFEWEEEEEINKNPKIESENSFKHDISDSGSGSSSRSSSAGRSSKRWVFLPDFLYRSKSDGRVNNKFWAKEKKPTSRNLQQVEKFATLRKIKNINNVDSYSNRKSNKPVNGVGKRRLLVRPPSPHEVHYTTKRTQAEEMRRKTFLPYRNGLFGCLRFSSSKGYGAAMDGFARALNPVSSR